MKDARSNRTSSNNVIILVGIKVVNQSDKLFERLCCIMWQHFHKNMPINHLFLIKIMFRKAGEMGLPV